MNKVEILPSLTAAEEERLEDLCEAERQEMEADRMEKMAAEARPGALYDPDGFRDMAKHYRRNADQLREQARNRR